MNGITEIQSRVQSIQARVSSPPIAGRFNALFEAQLATASARTTAVAGTEETTAAQQESFSVSPLSAPASAQQTGAELVTLGVMLGMGRNPTTITPSGTVYTSAELADYMATHNIAGRNGRLSTTELTEVTGAWAGTGRLLPPAATAWEEMRSAAAADGIDLQFTDSYRSWESQNRAYQAHLRGDKIANVLPPGTSEHGKGLAVDVTNGRTISVGDPEYTWLRTYASQYGWYPISNESWHWEFRGT